MHLGIDSSNTYTCFQTQCNSLWGSNRFYESEFEEINYQSLESNDFVHDEQAKLDL